MPDFTMRIEGLDKLMNNFEKAGVNYKPIITQSMDKSTKHIQQTIRNKIVSEKITFQGSLGKSVTVVEANEKRGVVGIGERYGEVVEGGRRAGSFPPVAPLERWAAIKLGQPGLGFVIARKIAQQGTKPHPYVAPSFREAAPGVLQFFKDGVNTIFRMMAKG